MGNRAKADAKTDVLIAASPCDQCLFSKNKVVSDERKAEFLAKCETKGSAFLCHKHTLRGMELKGAARSRANRVACHLHYKNFGHLFVYTMGRVFGVLKFVDSKGVETNGEENTTEIP